MDEDEEMGENARQQGLVPKWPRATVSHHHVILFPPPPVPASFVPTGGNSCAPTAMLFTETTALFYEIGAKPSVQRPEGCSSEKPPPT